MPKPVKVGDTASRTKIFTEQEVQMFANLSLDHNPIHLDAEYAKSTIFHKPVVHGMLVASLFSGILGMDLPGEGTIAMSLTVSFKRPVFIGEEVTATVEVVAVREDKPIVTMKVYAKNSAGDIVIEGEGLVRV